jgi:hypothetical protein
VGPGVDSRCQLVVGEQNLKHFELVRAGVVVDRRNTEFGEVVERTSRFGELLIE